MQYAVQKTIHWNTNQITEFKQRPHFETTVANKNINVVVQYVCKQQNN